MESYMRTLSAPGAFPEAKMALVGHEFHGGRSAVAWNEEVFNGTNSTEFVQADAATVHIYTVIGNVGINVTNVNYRGPEMLAEAWQFDLAQSGFLRSTIPARYRLWITEMGHRSRNQWATPEIDGTWLEGLYVVVAVC
jgi:hypothetical protein